MPFVPVTYMREWQLPMYEVRQQLVNGLLETSGRGLTSPHTATRLEWRAPSRAYRFNDHGSDILRAFVHDDLVNILEVVANYVFV